MLRRFLVGLTAERRSAMWLSLAWRDLPSELDAFRVAFDAKQYPELIA